MKKIKILMITIMIIITIILCILMYFLFTQKSKQDLMVIEDTGDDMSYMQGPLKQNIEDLAYNGIEYIHVTDKQMAEKYFHNYMQMMMQDTKKAYHLLEDEYKEKKFKTYEEYNTFVQRNMLFLKQNELEDIIVTDKETYKIYTCKDKYGNIYVFKEASIMEYHVQLDDYTLNNERFNEIYQKAEDSDKGVLNVDKFFKMINMQDYASAYNVLDENFKQNYFKTQADFETYIKSKVFRYNKVTYQEYSNKITDIYTYKIQLTDKTEEKQGQVEFNMVVKLLEGTNFVMSFAVN